MLLAEQGKSRRVKRISDFIGKYPKLLSLLAGGFSATGFAPLGWWPVTLLMLAFWMAMVANRGSWKQAALSGWFFGVGHFVVGLNWIAKAFSFQSAMPEWLGYIAVVLLSLYLAVYPALAALGAWSIAKKLPFVSSEVETRGGGPKRLSTALETNGFVFIIAMAGCWIITEWLRSWVFSGFIWNPLGSALLPLGKLPSATQYIGSYGLAAVAILAAGCVLLLVGRRWLIAAPLALAIAVPSIVTADSVFLTSPIASAQPLITVVQPNIGQQDKWKAGYEEENLQKLADLTVRKNDEPRILFWPEAAIPDYLEAGYPKRYYYGRPPEFVRQQLASLMKPGDVLVLGALKLEFDNANERAVGARNSVFAMDSDKELLGRYDKGHLVPYGEYLPMRPVLEAIGLSRLAPGDFDFWPGPGPRSLNLGKFGKTGLQVCYEIIFSGQVVDRDNRPDFIFNPSNDAWFGAWGPPQHLAQARLRAIEEGLPVIRSTPTGISAVIDANGVVKDSVPMGVAGKIETALPQSKSPTLFSRHGNILPLAFAVFLIICAIAIRLHAR